MKINPMARIAVIAILFLTVASAFATASGHGSNVAPGVAATAASHTSMENQGNFSYEMNSTALQAPALNSTAKWASMEKLISSRLDQSSVPSMARYLPNFAVGPREEFGSYAPSYTSAPAPMGVASYGTENSSGRIVPYTYKTSGFEGEINLTSATEFYMESDSPHSFSLQLNAVLNNVTLFGRQGFQYWTQNVVDYSTRTGQLTLIDNIWNFSSPSAVINGNEFHSHNGTVVPGVFYYDIGPTINVAMPFTLKLFLAAAVIDGYDTVFFNYSVSGHSANGSAVIQSGTYDTVQFNSTAGSASAAAPAAYYEVSGNTLTGTGFIPMDAEFILGGPGGGSTANFYNISANMSLMMQNSGKSFSSVGSAYTAGSETGETSSGISEYFSGHTAYLGTGPSFVEPLWNLTTKPGFATVSGNIDPSSAFVFISNTTNFNNNSAQWSPVNSSGSFTFRLEPGNYSVEFLLSYHDPETYSIGYLAGGKTDPLGTVMLHSDASRGLYTPIYIFGNGQLKNFSQSGTGTEASPYVIDGPYSLSTGSVISNVFSRTNDYLFPVFNAILVSGTTDYTIFSGFKTESGGAPFLVHYSSPGLASLTQSFDVPEYNYLPSAFYNSSNFVINDSAFSGWFSTIVFNNYSADNVPVVASLILWNSTDSLVEHSVFYSQGSGLLVYNDNSTQSDNYVWNNSFTDYPETYPGMYYGYAPIGATIESSGNTVFNNAFTSTIPVVSIGGHDANIYTGGTATYTDNFNVSRAQGKSGITHDGILLRGSILNTSVPGGNYYYDYFGNGSEPYNGSGLGFVFNNQGIFNGSINDGYDRAPLTLYGFETNVSTTGLPSGTETYFDVNNAIYPIYPGSSTSIYLPNGSYFLEGFELVSAQVHLVPTTDMGHLSLPSGDFSAIGPVMNITLAYGAYFNLTVRESGLPNGTQWGFAVPAAGQGYELTADNQSLFVQQGIYAIDPLSVDGYYASSIAVNVQGPVTATIYYSNVSYSSGDNFTVIFTETGLTNGSKWGITIGGQSFTTESTGMAIYGFQNGIYNYSVITPSGYRSSGSGQIVIDHGNGSVAIAFVSTSPEIHEYEYIGAGALAGAVIGAVAMSMRKRRP